MDEIFLNFKDQNHFLNYIYFIFIHLPKKSLQITVKTPNVVRVSQTKSKQVLQHSFHLRLPVERDVKYVTLYKVTVLIHMHEPHSSGVRRITHFVRVAVVMSSEKVLQLRLPVRKWKTRNLTEIVLVATFRQIVFSRKTVYLETSL